MATKRKHVGLLDTPGILGSHLIGQRHVKRNLFFPRFVMVSVVILTVASIAFSFYGQRHPQIGNYKLMMKHHPPTPYRHLTPSDISQTPRPLPGRLFHVAKEFGEASMGGLGSVLTALTASQAQSHVDVNVVIPRYSYVYEKHRFEGDVVDSHELEVVIQPCFHPFHIWDDWNPWGALKSLVFGPGPGRILKVRFEVFRFEYRGVQVYMISPGDVAPFSDAFKASDSSNIYSFTSAFPSEYRDMYFCMAVSQFLDREHQRKPISYIQLHGATNSLILPIMRRISRYNQLTAGPEAPGFIYTLHDYLDETAYSIRIPIIERFLPFPFEADPEATHSVIGNRLYLSIFGIRGADVVSSVSQVLARDLLSGMDFFNREIIYEDLAEQGRRRRFFGINNGVDLNQFSPFDNPQLKAAGLELVERENPLAQKRRAKKYLVERGLLTQEQGDLTVVLYIGRFQHNKGLDAALRGIAEFRRRKMVLILMGQKNDFPIEEFDKDKDMVIVIEDQNQQEELGVFVRLAADLSFVPSRTEAFGLVAAEAMLFGNMVISTGAGGLRDFLIDRKDVSPGEQHNAYLFDFLNTPSLWAAIVEAGDHLNSLDDERRGALCQHLIKTAQAMSWGRVGGPTDTYSALYHYTKTKQAEGGLPPMPKRDVLIVDHH